MGKASERARRGVNGAGNRECPHCGRLDDDDDDDDRNRGFMWSHCGFDSS